MIFSVIINSSTLKHIYEKRDCLNWQPLTLMSDEILELVEKTKNQKTRIERFAAYSLLFYVLEKIFGYKVKEIKKTEAGKPYINDDSIKDKLFISISHSGDISAVTVSNEGECGVDVQLLPNEQMMENVGKRFLGNFVLSNTDFSPMLESKYFSSSGEFIDTMVLFDYRNKVGSNIFLVAEYSKDGFVFTPFNFERDYNQILLNKWTACEALLKCSGGGFNDLKNLNEFKEKCGVYSFSFKVERDTYSLAVSWLKR